MAATNEFEYKPVEMFCLYDTTPTAATTGRVNQVAGDTYGRLMIVGGGAANASTLGINPFLVGGVGTGGSITTLNTTGGTIGIDSEFVIADLRVFSDSTGTEALGLIDSSRRLILAPTSTVNIIPQNNDSATEIRAQVVGSTMLLTSSPSRISLLIQNVSTVDAYIGFGATASTLGYKLVENAAYEINQTNMYNGRISVISESATGTADIRITTW